MALINSVVLVGHLTRDAEIKHFNNGNSVLKFSIAQNRKKKQGDAWVDEAMFFDCSYGNKGTEALHKYLIKGKQIAVQGEVRQERWEQDGAPRAKVFIAAFELQLLGGQGTDQGRQGPQSGRQDAGAYNPAEQYHPQPGAAQDRFEDDIPF
jgi:single-strand DNA-binding protein